MGLSNYDEAGRVTSEAKDREQELQKLYPGYKGVDEDYVHVGIDALERWWDWKFGMRIHWSLYSIMGRDDVGESWPLSKFGQTKWKIASLATYRAQYDEQYKWWNPCKFNADQWCEMMVRAGMKYFTFTSKHHDGFSMYDTKTKVKKRFVHTGTEAGNMVDCDLHYSIMETPFKRDIMGELVKSGRKHDLGIGIYFSHIDWFDADFRIDEWNYYRDESYTRESDPEGFNRMLTRHRNQLLEICSNYGDIDMLSLDTYFPEKTGVLPDLIKTVKMLRRLQPNMLMRHRGVGAYGDYKTPEVVIPETPEQAKATINIPWKVIYPGGECFSYVWGDLYKTPKWIIQSLIDITSKGGNFQVGYGPGPDGTWDKLVVDYLAEVGDWLKINGEGIYATRPYKVFHDGEDIRFTRSKDGKYVYAFVMNWPEKRFGGGVLSISSVTAKTNAVITMLGVDHKFAYNQTEKKLTIVLPEWLAEKLPSRIALCFKIPIDKI